MNKLHPDHPRKIFIAHSIGMTDKAVEYAKTLGAFEVYVPGIDTIQTGTEKEILEANRRALKDADECHVLWDLSSLGTIFDMGMAFGLGIPIYIVKTKTHHWTKFVVKREGKYLIE